MKTHWPATVVHRVDDVAQAHPDHPALREENGTELTYSQMQERVALIASQLLSRGVGPGTRVGVFQSPSADWICSFLAILRAGGTYVPLDKKVGMGRLTVIASESSLKLILVDPTTTPDCRHLRTAANLIDVSSLGVKSAEPVPNFSLSTQTAVIMFTSGSTGTPKGIAIGHSAYVQHIEAFSRTAGIQGAREIILHQSSYAWDMSLYQILVSLCNAATLVIANTSTRGDPVAISNLIMSSKVTTSFATPTEYLAWLRHGRAALTESNLMTAVSGGEFVSNGLINEIRSLAKSNLRLINVYGPAETTLACTSGEVHYMEMDACDDSASLRLHSLPNYSVYIVDNDLKPVPLGVPGEVVVGGAGIAQGYLDTDMTKKRFVPDRYASPFFESQGWTNIHLTGDRGKFTSDGALILLGRIDGDNQIKFGGIRINVEEIEAALVQASKGSITQAVVSPRTPEHDDRSQPFLVTFVVLADADIQGNQADFSQRFLQDLPLPQYMRPAAIIPIHSIPQNTSGKVDRLAVKDLPIPKVAPEVSSDDSLAPFEETLRQLWQEAIPPDVVSLYTIQSHSDFFHVGGSSLSLVTLQAFIKDRLAISVPLHSLFEASTLHGMAQRIQNLSVSSGETVDWDDEIESLLDFDESPLALDTNNMPVGAGVVVMTGATGFIGKEIVRQLVDEDGVRAIYCVATRKPLARLPAIFASPKVHVYHGDLAAPQLGLSDADATFIFSRADVVIHNGADVSFMKSYHTLKLSNVISTQELARLALPRRIPFHFVSSASATRLASKDSFGETSLAAYPPPSVPEDGYTAVKWVGEVFLERVSQRFGLPVWIHRPSSVTGTDAPELDLMSNVIRYCQETKKIPDSGSWSGVFDFVSVQSAATQIIDAVHSSGAQEAGTGGVRYQHESGEIQLGQDEVQSLMETGTGQQFEVVPVGEWVDHAEKTGMSHLLGVYLRKASAGQVLLPRLVKGSVDGGSA